MMDKNETLGVLSSYVRSRVLPELSAESSVPSYFHLGDERIGDVEWQWWSVSFYDLEFIKTVILRVSYSQFLDAAQVERFDLSDRKVYDSWQIRYVSHGEACHA